MDDLEKRYKRNEDFVFRKINDEAILVPIRHKVGDMECIYTLNETGAFVWENLDGERPLLDIRNMILEEFEVSPEETERDLCEFLGQLKEIDAVSERARRGHG
ncbi:MAG: PqqD family protein [Deltaproteobacteria bacterium]|nr:PqqD family protein [Deltaproteobacteria bacterium]